MNQPRPVTLHIDRKGRPHAVELRGRKRTVERIEEVWRIDAEWWREHPVRRTYFRLALDDGPLVVVYHDDYEAGWWMQTY